MKQLLLSFLSSFFLLTVSEVNAQSIVWGVGIGNGVEQTTSDMSTDINGNLIIVGNFKGINVDFDPSAGTTLLSSAGDRDIYFAKYNSVGSIVFAYRIGGTGNDAAINVATDINGNIYVSGWFRGTVDFDPSANTFNLVSNGESTGSDNDFGGDAFLVKYNSSGAFQWAINVGSSSIYDTGGKILIDANGSVLWGGSFTGSNVDFDPSSSINALSTQGVTESFLAKYNSNGQFIYAKRFGGASVQDCALRDIVIDNANNIYLTGHFDGTIDLNPDALVTNNFTSNGCGDIYVVKLNSVGQYIWAFNVGGSNCDYPWAMGIDANNNIYITGQLTSSNADFNPGLLVNSLSSNGATDIFIAKYDQNGNYVFANVMGGVSDDVAYAIKVQSSSFILTGSFSGTVDFNPGAGVSNQSSNGGRDIFVAKYDLAGIYQSAFKIGSANDDFGRCISSTQNDIFTIGGGFQGTNIDFDPAPASQLLLSSNGDYDIFMAKYSWSSILPYLLKDFSGIVKEKSILLQWQLSTETEVISYNIEKSINGIDFEIISSIPSKGNFSNTTFEFEDFKVISGDYFYRLKIMDKAGRTSYSKILKFYFGKLDYSLALYPNPINNGKLTVTISDNQINKPFRLKVINLAGEIVYNSFFEKGVSGKLEINVNQYLSGVYIIQVANDKGIIITNSFIKQ